MAKPPGSANRLPLFWVGNANEALCEMPEEVRLDFGRRLNLAQRGRLPPNTKPWHGVGSGVYEMVEEFDGDAFRCVYLARYETAIYVLHAFQKKASTGSKTSQLDVEAIKIAFKSAIEEHKEQLKNKDHKK